MLIGAAIAVTMFISLMSLSIGANGVAPTNKVADMIAGGGNTAGAKDVGDILAWNDGTNLFVKYQIVDQTPSDPSDNWWISETHLAVATSLAGIPHNSNSLPKPGQFKFGETFAQGVTEALYTIKLTDIGSNIGAGTQLYIAAHAVVGKGGMEAVSLYLPNEVTVTIPSPSGYSPTWASRFPGTVVSGGTILDGTYNAWCGNEGPGQIPYNTPTQALVYSSYDDGIPTSVIENQENLDALNWLINHKSYIGQPWTVCAAPAEAPAWWGQSPYGTSGGPYDPSTFPTDVTVTWFDFQMAIYYLIDTSISYDSDYCFMHQMWFYQSKVGYDLAQLALTNGEGFVPCSGMKMVVILAPEVQSHDNQPILIDTTVPCKGGYETAWGVVGGIFGDVSGTPDGLGPQNKFNASKNWSEYIPYRVT